MPHQLILFEEDYIGGPSAEIDWVAGGNFDGYVYKKILRFSKDNTVKMTTVILNQSKYDGHLADSEITGNYKNTDHNTITCYFGTREMRGVVLGEQGEYLAFSVHYPGLHTAQIIKECYKLKH